MRVMKNFQICHNCYSFMKHVSNTFDRENIILDQNWFRHFFLLRDHVPVGIIGEKMYFFGLFLSLFCF
jgi:hypothetical protein